MVATAWMMPKKAYETNMKEVMIPLESGISFLKEHGLTDDSTSQIKGSKETTKYESECIPNLIIVSNVKDPV